MTKTLRAVFDGKVLRPEEPVDLTPDTRYVVTVEREEEREEMKVEEAYPLTHILELATDMGITDLSTRHNWYAHGHPEDDRGGD